jgi:hypothetical protein
MAFWPMTTSGGQWFGQSRDKVDRRLAVFQEMNVGVPVWSVPHSQLHQLLEHLVAEAFVRGGVEMAMGARLHEVFVAAGLEAPEMRTDALIGAGAKVFCTASLEHGVYFQTA